MVHREFNQQHFNEILMKEIIFSLLFAFGMLMVNVTPTKADTTDQVSELTIDRFYDDVKSLGQSAGIKLDSVVTKATRIAGETIENLWTILVQQQRVKGYTQLFILLIGIFLLFNISKWILAVYNNLEDDADSIGNIMLLITLIVVSILIIIYNYLHLLTITTGIFNPEYGALIDLYNIANGLLKP